MGFGFLVDKEEKNTSSPEAAAAAETKRSWNVSAMQIKEIKQTDHLKYKRNKRKSHKSTRLGKKIKIKGSLKQIKMSSKQKKWQNHKELMK